MLNTAVLTVNVVGDNANVAMGYAKGFQLAHGAGRIGIIVKKACNGLGHGFLREQKDQ